MTDMLSKSCTVFCGHQRIASGSLQTVAPKVKRAVESRSDPVLVFDDMTGRLVLMDTRGSDEEVVARLAEQTPADHEAAIAHSEDTDDHRDERRGRGRPKLGVVPREVTLLPRHWEWLAAQPGGASVVLRKLVDEARRTNGDKDRIRKAHERAYRFMSAVAGNMPDFEEASRALFANDQQRFSQYVAAWPEDVGEYAIQLAFGDDDPKS